MIWKITINLEARDNGKSLSQNISDIHVSLNRILAIEGVIHVSINEDSGNAYSALEYIRKVEEEDEALLNAAKSDK